MWDPPPRSARSAADHRRQPPPTQLSIRLTEGLKVRPIITALNLYGRTYGFRTVETLEIMIWTDGSPEDREVLRAVASEGLRDHDLDDTVVFTDEEPMPAVPGASPDHPRSERRDRPADLP